MPKRTLSFAAIREAGTNFKKQEVEVEEWNTKVFVRQLSAREQQDISRLLKKREGEELAVEDMTVMLAKCTEDCDGQHPDPEWLADQPLAVLVRLTKIANTLNGVSDAAVDVLEKNSQATEGSAAASSV